MTQHPHQHRNDVELLAHHLAEALELHCVMRAGAFILGQPMLDVDARQRFECSAHRGLVSNSLRTDLALDALE